MRRFLVNILLLIFAGVSFDALGEVAQSGKDDQSLEIRDGINRDDPNFITASILLIEPCGKLYSCLGHACFRLECPTFKLDNCFSYESEPVGHRVLTFFAGKLNMGMFVTPTAEFLKDYKEECRGIRQYKLNLPPDVKQRLWKALDDKVAEGAYLPYDYDKRGCAWTVLSTLMETLKPGRLEVKEPLPGKFTKTRRELMHSALDPYPWNRFFMHAIWGTSLDREMPGFENVVVPADLMVFLSKTSFMGNPILCGEEKVLVSMLPKEKPFGLSPVVAASCVVVMAILGWFWMSRTIDIVLLVLQSVAGVFFCYLVIASKLPATTWNWLIVPFNLLPLVFWKWRDKWSAWFVGALMAWVLFVLLYPHRLTDTAFVIMAIAYIVQYLKFSVRHFVDLKAKGEKNNEKMVS